MGTMVPSALVAVASWLEAPHPRVLPGLADWTYAPVRNAITPTTTRTATARATTEDRTGDATAAEAAPGAQEPFASPPPPMERTGRGGTGYRGRRRGPGRGGRGRSTPGGTPRRRRRPPPPKTPPRARLRKVLKASSGVATRRPRRRAPPPRARLRRR